MDLIVNMPVSGGFDGISVIVDRVTKGALFIPTTTNLWARTIADALFDHEPVQRGFLPLTFIMDWDPRLIKGFWKALYARLKNDYRKATPYYAQSDSAAERLNQTLEIALPAYTSQPKCTDWHKQLSLIELDHGSALNESTGFTPFQLLFNPPQSIVKRLLTPQFKESD